MRNSLKIISLFILLTVSLFANTQKINECKTDLYYANGIMIKESKQEARKLWENKAKELFSTNPQELKTIGKIDISYNVSQDFFSDLFESAEQAISNEWGWSEFSNYFRTYLELKGYQDSVDQHRPNLNAQVKVYKESIKLGHGVIVIAHSQGNYYTNEAYEKLGEWMKDYFHMFGVATPANHVAGFPVDDAAAPYVLFHNDFINSIVTALPSNLDDTRHHGFPSIDAHDFYESYMKEETAKKMINDFIIDEIQEHSKNDSQWELDQELNKGTKDYKITLKHRFDSSVIMDEEVYPFNAAKKLYYVQGLLPGDISGYVKARCGGYKVETTWVGQDTATQIAKLSHTTTTLPQEYIALKCGEGYHFEGTSCVITPFVGTVYVSGGNNMDTWNDWSVGLCYSQFTDYNVLTFATASIGNQLDCSNFIRGQKFYPRPYTGYDTTPIHIALEASMIEMGGAGKALAGSLVSQVIRGFHPSTYTISTTEDDGTDIWNIWVSYKITGI